MKFVTANLLAPCPCILKVGENGKIVPNKRLQFQAQKGKEQASTQLQSLIDIIYVGTKKKQQLSDNSNSANVFLKVTSKQVF